jgi:hypothetical protein
VYGWAVRNTERAYLWLREVFDLVHWKSCFEVPKGEQMGHEDLERDISRRHRWWAVVFVLSGTAEMGLMMMIPTQTFYQAS